MRTDNDNIVSKHYIGYNHTSDDYLVCAVNTGTHYNKRLRIEKACVALLDIIYPKGLNTRM